jgi:hypothetical protein
VTVADWPSWPSIAAPLTSEVPTEGMLVTAEPSVPYSMPATLL